MQIIILIIIIVLVVKYNKKKEADSKKNGSGQSGTAYQSGSSHVYVADRNSTLQRSTMSGSMQNGNRSAGGYQANTKSAGSKTTGSSPASDRSTNRVSINSKAEKEQKQESVVEYLNKKAAEDQAEHLEEERQAAIRHRKMYGNAKVGGRLLLGDAIPRGMMKVDCGYCGAENLLRPGDRGNCLCYFCRTKL